MSRFTGKCDFCDLVEMFKLDDPKNSGMKVRYKDRELSVDEYPLYYTHIVSSMGCSKNEDGSYEGLINLSESDYNEYNNEKIIKVKFDAMCKAVRHYKKKGCSFTAEDVKNKSGICFGDEIDTKIAYEAIRHGGKNKNVDIKSLIKENNLYSSWIEYHIKMYNSFLYGIGLLDKKEGNNDN